MIRKYISWRRVSTFKQGKSGLGLEAQKEIIRYFVERDGGELIADYSECYTGKELSGCKELRKAMKYAKETGAILVIAKSDRFRNCQEALGILDEMGEGNIEFCDLPHSDRFTLTLFWALAEREALITSIRTKQALAAKKARGEKLGASCDRYAATMRDKSREELEDIARRRGETKKARYLASRDVQAFLKVLRNTFPDACRADEPSAWNWSEVNTKAENRAKMLNVMRDYNSLDSTTFSGWQLEDSKEFHHKMAHFIGSIKRNINN